jgi:hypothetical protein
MPQEPHVEFPPGPRAVNSNIGGVLGLMGRPVVAIPGELVAQERVHPAGEDVEHSRPRERREAISKPLHAPEILEPKEGAKQGARASISVSTPVKLAAVVASDLIRNFSPLHCDEVNLAGHGEGSLRYSSRCLAGEPAARSQLSRCQ